MSVGRLSRSDPNKFGGRGSDGLIREKDKFQVLETCVGLQPLK